MWVGEGTGWGSAMGSSPVPGMLQVLHSVLHPAASLILLHPTRLGETERLRGATAAKPLSLGLPSPAPPFSFPLPFLPERR